MAAIAPHLSEAEAESASKKIGAKILEVLGAITPEADSAIIEHGADLRAGVVEP